MQKKIEAYMEKWQMLDAGDHIIVGVSGGADSVCLLMILNACKERFGFTLTAVHVNHGIRGEEADSDEQYVKELCLEQGIPCECRFVDVPGYAEKERLSEEEAGRLARRMVFEEVRSMYGGTKIALAHHQDDNAETFFMNVARGSRLKGLGGICPVTGRYIRPLLCVTRKEIECFLEERGIHYCIDSTNQSEEYMRNRIRNRVLPYFEEHVNPQTVRHINGTMEQLRQIQLFIEKKADEAYETCVVPGVEDKSELIIQGQNLMKQEEILRPVIVYRAIAYVAQKEKDLEEVHVSQTLDLLEKQTGRKVDLPYQLEAVRTYEGILIQKRKESPQTGMQESKSLDFSKKEGSLDYCGYQVSWRVFPKAEMAGEMPKKAYTKWFDYDIMKHNTVVRTRQSGDRIVIDKEGREQKLKAFFINEKVPAGKRSEILLIASADQIWWIAGYRQSKACQVKEKTTTVLEIRIDGGNQDGRDS